MSSLITFFVVLLIQTFIASSILELYNIVGS